MPRLLTALLVLTLTAPTAFAQGFGDVKGQIVFEGDIPNLAPLVAKGGIGQNGAPVKDAAICGANAVADNSLVVDPTTKGIANVFIYLKSAPAVIHPNLQAIPAQPAVFDQKGCSFEPHALVVRSGQAVEVRSQDACAHNTHTFPIKNDAVNFLLPPNPKPFTIPGDKTQKAEILPIQVKCDIHAWMSAYWLILDHPYAVVSAADGTFEIKNLPAGEHEIRIWHERAGYLDRGLDVVVTANQTTEVPVSDTTYPAKDFED